MGDVTENSQRRATSAASSERSKSTAGAKVARKRQKKKATYKQKRKPVIERLMAQMDLILLTGMDEVADAEQEEKWSNAECLALVRLFINKRG